VLTIGWQLGSDADIQVANPTNNHLTSALMKYFCASGRWDQGIDFFSKLRKSNEEVSLLQAQLYLEMGLA
jgi:pentatricopeptide repeat protein